MKAAIYCRLSEEDRDKRHEGDDSASIQNQKSMLLQYAMEQGWEIFQIYSDDDYAGSDRRRPGFQRLLRDAEQRKFDVVLCKTQSRFTRELELVEKYIHGLFPLWGIRFISIVDNADTANKGNKKSRQINGLVNEWYLEDMSENIRSVLTNRRQNGFHIGSFALYGYRKDPEHKGRLLIDEEAAVVVREVFTLYSQGCGKTAIARLLNERGIPNPTEYKRLCGLRYRQPKGRGGTLWKYSAISSMLVNEIYIGNMVQGKYGSLSYKTRQNRPRPREEWIIVEGTHEPIIDRKLWDRVQSLIKQKAKPFAGGSIGLFAGKARCMNCGYTLCSTVSRGRHYLQCPNRHVAKDACAGAFISVDRLEQLVREELNRLTAEYLDLTVLEQEVTFCDDLREQKGRLLSDLILWEKKKAEYGKAIRELYLDKARGLLSESDYREMSEDFNTSRERLAHRIADGKRKLSEMEEFRETDGTRRERIEQSLYPQRLSRGFVDALVNYILIGKRIPGSRDVPVEIHWNF